MGRRWVSKQAGREGEGRGARGAVRPLVRGGRCGAPCDPLFFARQTPPCHAAAPLTEQAHGPEKHKKDSAIVWPREPEALFVQGMGLGDKSWLDGGAAARGLGGWLRRAPAPVFTPLGLHPLATLACQPRASHIGEESMDDDEVLVSEFVAGVWSDQF